MLTYQYSFLSIPMSAPVSECAARTVSVLRTVSALRAGFHAVRWYHGFCPMSGFSPFGWFPPCGLVLRVRVKCEILVCLYRWFLLES